MIGNAYESFGKIGFSDPDPGQAPLAPFPVDEGIRVAESPRFRYPSLTDEAITAAANQVVGGERTGNAGTGSLAVHHAMISA